MPAVDAVYAVTVVTYKRRVTPRTARAPQACMRRVCERTHIYSYEGRARGPS